MAAFATRIVLILLISLFLFSTGLLVTAALEEAEESDLVSLSYQAYTGLAAVYRAGGNTSAMVAQLNGALRQIQEARIKAASGQTEEAQALQEQANGTLERIVAEIPAAQQQAQLDVMHRRIVVLSFVPISVVVCTLVSYLVIRTWRRYDRSRLYEMRIVEENED